MKKFIAIFVLVFMLIGITSTSAQWKDNSAWFSMNLGYTPLTNPESDNTMDGWSANFTYEKFLKGSPFALGANLGWINSGDDYFSGSDRIIMSFQTFMLSLSAKYAINSDNISYYLGLGLGWFTTNGSGSKTVGLTTQQEIVYFDGVSVSAALGLNVFVSENTFLGLNVVPFWAENPGYKSDINFMINGTIGFQM